MSEEKKEQRKDFEETANAFKEQMENLANMELPPHYKKFAEMVEALKQDESALEKLREEILKHYGE
tara:strand:+ start:408 stop:605 length:198 start_codon:yes stop_codon:yes gene_type:complete